MTPGGMNGIERERKDRALRRSKQRAFFQQVEVHASKGLRLFESAFRRKSEQLSVLEFG